jgi:hypothetical protein
MKQSKAAKFHSIKYKSYRSRSRMDEDNTGMPAFSTLINKRIKERIRKVEQIAEV